MVSVNVRRWKKLCGIAINSYEDVKERQILYQLKDIIVYIFDIYIYIVYSYILEALTN